jgi:hypothetical protein
MKVRIFAASSVLVFCIFGQAYGQTFFSAISDYPRYGTEPSPTQREDVRNIARQIVDTLLTGGEVNLTVIGHADFDAKGQDFELDVSLKRALGAEMTIRSLVQEEIVKTALPATALQSVHSNSIGLGTARPIHSPPDNDEERKQNRRVDFVIAGTPKPPASESAFQRCVRVLAGNAPPGPVRRMTCACNKFLQVTPRVADTHYDFQARKRLPALSTLSPKDLALAVNSIILHLRHDIRGVASDTMADRDVITGLLALDDTVGRNINDFVSQEVGGSAMSIFDRVVVTDIGSRMRDPNHVYSCYSGYSRRNHDQ